MEYSGLLCDFLFELQTGLGCAQNYAHSFFLILYEVKTLSLYSLLHWKMRVLIRFLFPSKAIWKLLLETSRYLYFSNDIARK